MKDQQEALLANSNNQISNEKKEKKLKDKIFLEWSNINYTIISEKKNKKSKVASVDSRITNQTYTEEKAKEFLPEVWKHIIVERFDEYRQEHLNVTT